MGSYKNGDKGFHCKICQNESKKRKNEELTLQNKINELQLSLERNPNNNHALQNKRRDPQEQGMMV